MGRRPSVGATAERAALLDYLRGGWAECTHEGVGLPGCPTCEGRWSSDVRRVVQEHRDRVRAEVKAEIDARTDTLDELRHRAWSRVAELEAQHVTDTAACISVNHERSQVRRQRDEALAEVAQLHEQVEQLQARIAAERSVASADPSSERTRRAVVHLLESLGREIGDDSVASGLVEALAVLLGVDRA